MEAKDLDLDGQKLRALPGLCFFLSFIFFFFWRGHFKPAEKSYETQKKDFSPLLILDSAVDLYTLKSSENCSSSGNSYTCVKEKKENQQRKQTITKTEKQAGGWETISGVKRVHNLPYQGSPECRFYVQKKRLFVTSRRSPP